MFQNSGIKVTILNMATISYQSCRTKLKDIVSAAVLVLYFKTYAPRVFNIGARPSVVPYSVSSWPCWLSWSVSSQCRLCCAAVYRPGRAGCRGLYLLSAGVLCCSVSSWPCWLWWSVCSQYRCVVLQCIVLAVLALVAVGMAAPEKDAPADVAEDDLQGSEIFFRNSYYRPRYHSLTRATYGAIGFLFLTRVNLDRLSPPPVFFQCPLKSCMNRRQTFISSK